MLGRRVGGIEHKGESRLGLSFSITGPWRGSQQHNGEGTTDRRQHPTSEEHHSTKAGDKRSTATIRAQAR